jgi:hypothetical protein
MKREDGNKLWLYENSERGGGRRLFDGFSPQSSEQT